MGSSYYTGEHGTTSFLKLCKTILKHNIGHCMKNVILYVNVAKIFWMPRELKLSKMRDNPGE